MSYDVNFNSLRFFLGGPALVANDSIEKCAKKNKFGICGNVLPRWFIPAYLNINDEPKHNQRVFSIDTANDILAVAPAKPLRIHGHGIFTTTWKVDFYGSVLMA